MTLTKGSIVVYRGERCYVRSFMPGRIIVVRYRDDAVLEAQRSELSPWEPDAKNEEDDPDSCVCHAVSLNRCPDDVREKHHPGSVDPFARVDFLGPQPDDDEIEEP